MKFVKYLFTIATLLFPKFINLYPQESLQLFEDDLKVSLLTYSPGSKLYSVFGHSAIRVYNRSNHSDNVYNYGTFRFDQSKFYLKFIQGNLIYSLSRTSFENAKQNLIIENRSLIETPLNLNAADKKRMVKYLETNLLPLNRDYRYDFLYDNCATRILNLFEKNISDSLIIKPEVLPVQTFRQLIHPYVKNRPWITMGIDLLMGTKADKKARFTEATFLPDFLHLFVKNFRLSGKESSHRLSGHDIIHFQSYQIKKERKLTPALILWPLALLFLISALIDSYLRSFFRQAGNIVLFLVGIISLFLCYLWIFSDHYIFRYNIDLFWVNPLLLIAAFLKISTNQNKFMALKKFFLLSIGFIIILGILSSMIVEKNFNLTALGIIVLIIVADKIKSFHFASLATVKSRYSFLQMYNS